MPRRPQGSWARSGAAVLAGLFLLGSALLSRPSANAAGTIVHITPAHIDVGVGETGDVSVAIVDAVDLYSADFLVGFNPNIAEIVDVDPLLGGVQIFPGSFPGPSEQPGSVLTNSADNVAGMVWYEFTLLEPAVPVSGSGTLATIRFMGKVPGATSVLIQSSNLRDQSGDDLEATFVDGTVSVYAGPEPSPTPTATPTPGTPTSTATPTWTPTATASPTATPSGTPSGTPSPTTTVTGTVTPESTTTGTVTPTPTGETATDEPEPSTGSPSIVLVPEEPSATPELVRADPLPPQAPPDPAGVAVTPTSSQAGVSGLPSAGEGDGGPLVPWRTLMAAGVIVLAAGGSWAFYYLTRGATVRE